MMDTNYEKLDDVEILRRLDDAALMDRFENSEDWKIVREACKRTADRAKEELLRVNPDKKMEIVELQKIAQIYGSFIPNLVKSYRQDGEMAFQEAKIRGLIDKIRAFFKTEPEK